jgi:hypothetical protein
MPSLTEHPGDLRDRSRRRRASDYVRCAFSSSGSLAILTAIRRALSTVILFALRSVVAIHVRHCEAAGVLHAPAASRAGDGPRGRGAARHVVRTSREQHIGKRGHCRVPIVPIFEPE